MPRTIGLVSVAALCVVLLSAYVTRWVIAIYSTISFLCGLLGCVLFLVSLLTLQKAKMKESLQRRQLGGRLLLVSVFLLLQFGYSPVTMALRNLEVRRAQRFVQSLVPVLEDYNLQHSAYPADISSVIAETTVYPPLLQLRSDFPFAYDNRQFYTSRAGTYGFEFYLPDGFIGFEYTYCCGSNGVWTVTD